MKLNLDEKTISRCRSIAADIAIDVRKTIDRYSTVSTERTCMRLLGIHGAKMFRKQGYPLANIVVDKLQEAGKLDKGAMYWMANACLHYNLPPEKIAERIADNEFNVGTLEEAPREVVLKKADALAKDALSYIVKKKNERNKIIRECGDPHDRDFQKPPLKYVIVASGNIFEDIVQACSAAHAGADVIAVIRSTAQSLLDFVPHGSTTEGFGGTYATQENFRLMRAALDEESKKLKRYIRLTNYASGLCMPEITGIAAMERLDFLLCDSLYGILFRDINMKRTFVDQHLSRLLCAASEIFINTGEDNYLTTADAIENGHQVLASDFVNEQFAINSNMKEEFMGLGHAMEMAPFTHNVILYEWARAQMTRDIFPKAPLKYMPPTRHMDGDIFFGHVYDSIFNFLGVATKQGIQLLGMPTEAIHTPFLMDRFMSIKSANYIFDGAHDLNDEIEFKANGKINRWAQKVLDDSFDLLESIQKKGLFKAIEDKCFAEVSRTLTGGKGHSGVFERASDYCNPILDQLESRSYEA